MLQSFSLTLLLLALSVSLDSFSVGFTYGLRKMRIPFKSILIISGCSAVTLIIAMFIGHLIQQFISPELAEKTGGVILIVLGGWIIYQFFRPDKEKDVLLHEKMIVNLEIKSLGLVIHILRKPMSADFDQSGTITGLEAFMLGLALSLDAFGAGIGAVMLGFSPLSLALSVAVLSSLLVFLGMKMGAYLSRISWLQKLSFLPGILLIAIGLLRF
jgi:putative sporulation protein YtaF